MINSNSISFYAEKIRKTIHISNLIFPLLIYLFSPKNIFPLFLTLSVLFVSIDILRIKIKYFKKIYKKIFGSITRDKEKNSLTGATNVMIGVTLVTYIFDASISIPSLIIMSISDTLAAIIGIRYGSIYLINNKKLEGSFSFFFSCCIILLLFKVNIFIAVLISMITTILELSINIKHIDDNLYIPLIVALLINILN